MYAVVNRLKLSTPIPPEVWSRAQAAVPPRARVATEVGNTWMRENVLPHLAAPPDRQIGKVVASSDS